MGDNGTVSYQPSPDFAGFLVTTASLFGFVGSLLIIGTIVHQKLYVNHKVHVLICSLAVSDTLGSFLNFLMGVAIMRQRMVWPFNSVISNRWFGCIHGTAWWSDSWTVLAISLVQVISINKFKWEQNHLTYKACAVIIVAAWLPCSGIIIVPLLPFVGIADHSFSPEFYSLLMDPHVDWYIPMLWGIQYTIVAICILCDVVILARVYQSKKAVGDSQHNDDHFKVIKALGIQFCYVNFMIVFVNLLSIPFYLGWWIGSLNTALLFSVMVPFVYGSNYYIYLFCNPSFRNATKRFLRALFRMKAQTGATTKTHTTHVSSKQKSKRHSTTQVHPIPKAEPQMAETEEKAEPHMAEDEERAVE